VVFCHGVTLMVPVSGKPTGNPASMIHNLLGLIPEVAIEIVHAQSNRTLR
jgi:hypothetical protein